MIPVAAVLSGRRVVIVLVPAYLYTVPVQSGMRHVVHLQEFCNNDVCLNALSERVALVRYG